MTLFFRAGKSLCGDAMKPLASTHFSCQHANPDRTGFRRSRAFSVSEAQSVRLARSGTAGMGRRIRSVHYPHPWQLRCRRSSPGCFPWLPLPRRSSSGRGEALLLISDLSRRAGDS